MRQLDLRQFPVEVEDILQLVHNAGDEIPDSIEHVRHCVFNAIQDT